MKAKKKRRSNRVASNDLLERAVLRERKACAKILRDKYNEWAKRSYPPPDILLELEAAILARSNAALTGAADSTTGNGAA